MLMKSFFAIIVTLLLLFACIVIFIALHPPREYLDDACDESAEDV